MPEKLTLESAAQDRQWVFPLLTLDVVRPFYDLMGLHQEAEARRHEALRAATLATRKQRAETLVSFCQDLQERIDPPVADHLAWWIGRVAYQNVQAHVPVSDWKDVLRRCHRKGQSGWCRLAFPKQLSSEAL